MSLSDDIIAGRYDQVAKKVHSGHDVNYIDEYGFTPLIQTAIVNSAPMAELLLKHGANVDAVDISGQRALHWAVDNNNEVLVELLLKYRANPNSYTTHAQPALFLPILRGKKKIQQRLIDHGADIHFAKDYIQAKLIGHRFELQGLTDVVSSEGVFLPIDLEGFFLEFTVRIIRDSLERFIKSYVAHRLDLPLEELKSIVATMKNAAHLREFKHYNVSVDKNIETIQKLIKRDLLLMPVSFEGHAITFIKHGPFLARCDRGVHKMTDPIQIHRIKRPEALNLDLYKHLLFERQTRAYITKGLNHDLQLKPFGKLPIRHQITGNCSWANVEASIPTMLFMLLYDKAEDKKNPKPLVKEVMTFYTVWKEWDKDRAIEEALDGFDHMNPNRRKSKASLMGAIFFQACDPRNPRDVKRAEKLLDILKRPEYHYVMRSYINVFLKSGKGKKRGKLFHELLKACGTPPSTFEY